MGSPGPGSERSRGISLPILPLLVLPLLLVGSVPGWADDSPEAAAAEVKAAMDAGKQVRVREIAGGRRPDPWLVADQLVSSGELEIAQAFAELTPGAVREPLLKYLRGSAAASLPAAVRASYTRALAAYEAGEKGIAFPDAGSLQPSVGAVQLTALRAKALVLAIARRLDDPYLEASALRNIAANLQQRGETERARSVLGEALAIHRRLGDRQAITFGLMNLAAIESHRRYHERALALYREALDQETARGGRLHEGFLLISMARVQLTLHDLPGAQASAKRAVEFARRTERREEEARAWGVLALGDPDYSRAAGSTVAVLRSGRHLTPLPATREEVRAVGTVVLVGQEATESRFRESLAKRDRWRAVHLACHGLVRSDRPLLSSLAITPGGGDDGFLTAMEILRLSVPADLAVLSACETGQGRVVEGEGLLGLVTAFFHAGAPRVLASLWNVDDDATGALMAKFYELWNPKKGKGLGAAAALKKAQAFVESQEKWKHPYYWAAWVLWGLAD